jgi:pimeloyl-ACP methyl ester carboxylesterase
MTITPQSSTSTQFIDRPGGRVAYEVAGDGPPVVLAPGMGDLRQSYRFLTPLLLEAGYRVASSDLRGHGESDATFPSYGDEETAGDLLALIDALGGPAVLVGNSMAAGAAVIAAANRPELVSGLVLVGPFVRNGGGALQRLMLRAMLAPSWAAAMWKFYLPKLYAGERPSDFDDYRDRVIASLRRPGYAKAFSLTTRLSHDPAEARLTDVTTPTLLLMGSRDPDFKDPRAEADWIAGRLRATVVMVEEAGHYPQSQQPRATFDAMDSFLKDVAPRA